MPRLHSSGHWAVDRRGSRRLVGASLLLTRRGAVLHSGVDEGRSTLSGHGQCHLLLFMLGQSCLYSFCVDIWDREREDAYYSMDISDNYKAYRLYSKCYGERVERAFAESTLLTKFHSHYQTCVWVWEFNIKHHWVSHFKPLNIICVKETMKMLSTSLRSWKCNSYYYFLWCTLKHSCIFCHPDMSWLLIAMLWENATLQPHTQNTENGSLFSDSCLSKLLTATFKPGSVFYCNHQHQHVETQRRVASSRPSHVDTSEISVLIRIFIFLAMYLTVAKLHH